jgi:hypothetical protein
LQVFNEARARMSTLASNQHVVLPLHVGLSREGGLLMTYPYAGRSMDSVCAALRTSGQQAQLLTQLADMATSVVLTLQKLQAQKSKVRCRLDWLADRCFCCLARHSSWRCQNQPPSCYRWIQRLLTAVSAHVFLLTCLLRIVHASFVSVLC